MILIVHHYVCHCFDIVMPVTTKPNEPVCHWYDICNLIVGLSGYTPYLLELIILLTQFTNCLQKYLSILPLICIVHNLRLRMYVCVCVNQSAVLNKSFPQTIQTSDEYVCKHRWIQTNTQLMNDKLLDRCTKFDEHKGKN